MNELAAGHAGQTDELDPESVRADFPILGRTVHGKPLVYLDTTASAQKPEVVLDALEHFYRTECSNVHRGLHELSMRATADFEASRTKVQRFIGAADPNEIVFTRGTTESINLVAQTFGLERIGRDDEILITEMEHHSNIVPWQLLGERTGARLKVAPIDDSGELKLDEFEGLIGPRTRLVALTHVSNALGTRNPVERIIEMAHAHQVPVLLDGAQGVVHETIDVQALGCDFYAFSGHKLYGPTGIGVLYGRLDLLNSLPPCHGGGDMIRSVSFEGTTYREAPHRFEAGTPNIAGAIGLGAAVDYLSRLGMDRVAAAEQRLVRYALEKLQAADRVTLVGTPQHRGGVISFNIDDVHPHDVGTILDRDGIAVRAGHHCAQPLMNRLGVPATVRASLGCYSVPREIDALISGIAKVCEVFS